MRPATLKQAQRQVHSLLQRKLTGIKSSMQREHQKRAKTIVYTLYREYQIGPYQIQCTHLHWYLSTQINHLKPATQYRHWLTIEKIIKALEKYDHWQTHLQGAWRKPSNNNF